MAAPKAVVESTSVISKQPHLYNGWPTLARRKNGQLLLVCSGGREAHVCPFGRVELMTSDDEGKTWTWPRVLLDSSIDDRDAGVVETAKGSILVTTFTSLAYTERAWPAERKEAWQAAHSRLTEEQRKKDLGVWMIRSTDGGLTWSSRYDCLVNSPHGPILLGDGTLLYAGKELWKKERSNGVCVSTDDGESWKWLAEVPTRAGDRNSEYHELHAVETAKGTIVLHLRNHNKTNERETLQCESSDGGKTWSEPHPIGVWGLPSHLLRLKDDRLLMSYGYRRKPYGVQARISEDHGKTWSEAMAISEDGIGGDLGYPSTVQLKDGSLLTAWYEVMREPRGRSVLRQARWKPA
jgi:Neuraminidase (sialidase)